MPAGTDIDLVASRIDAAKRTFERRNAALADRRQAVRELADVLEVLRPEIKEEMLPKDEQELFRLANGFAIRHNNRKQMRLYDDAIWLRWAFYVYLQLGIRDARGHTHCLLSFIAKKLDDNRHA